MFYLRLLLALDRVEYFNLIFRKKKFIKNGEDDIVKDNNKNMRMRGLYLE